MQVGAHKRLENWLFHIPHLFFFPLVLLHTFSLLPPLFLPTFHHSLFLFSDPLSWQQLKIMQQPWNQFKQIRVQTKRTSKTLIIAKDAWSLWMLSPNPDLATLSLEVNSSIRVARSYLAARRGGGSELHFWRFACVHTSVMMSHKSDITMLLATP